MILSFDFRPLERNLHGKGMKNFSAMVVLLFWAVAAAFGDPAEQLFVKGVEAQNHNDLPGALEDFTKAIEANSNYFKAYNSRAIVRQNLGDVAGAMSDFTKAIALSADSAEAYFGRGRLNQLTGHLEESLADFNESIKRRPAYVAIFGRGRVEQIQGKLDAALADFDKTIELTPQFASAYYFRGCLRYDQHLFDKALADFYKVCAMNSPADYGHIRLWLTQARMGQRDAATKDLSLYLTLRPGGVATGWIAKICAFLTGGISEGDFLKAAEEGDQNGSNALKREAFFLAGTVRLIGGDKAAAKDFFAKCVATGAPEDPSYQSAAAELKALSEAK